MGFDIITVCSYGSIILLVLGGGYILYQRYLNRSAGSDSSNFISNFRHTKKDECLGSSD